MDTIWQTREVNWHGEANPDVIAENDKWEKYQVGELLLVVAEIKCLHCIIICCNP